MNTSGHGAPPHFYSNPSNNIYFNDLPAPLQLSTSSCSTGRKSLGVISKVTSMFSFQSGRVKKLMNWKQTDGDVFWTQNAIEVLVKKMHKFKGREGAHIEMDKLEQILSNPSMPSNCITIPRSLDGRIQVKFFFFFRISLIIFISIAGV